MDVAELMNTLDDFSKELDQLSKDLIKVEREREVLQTWHDDVVEVMVRDLWAQYKAGEVRQWPGDEVRRALAREAMDPVRVSRLGRLNAARRRLTARIEDLRTGCSVRQTLLNAARAEMEAVDRTGGPRGQ